jgi:hypothetical protein
VIKKKYRTHTVEYIPLHAKRGYQGTDEEKRYPDKWFDESVFSTGLNVAVKPQGI